MAIRVVQLGSPRARGESCASAPDNARPIGLLAAPSHGADFSVGCYGEEEGRCHRSVLRQLLAESGAELR